jgi:hypothetical protein
MPTKQELEKESLMELARLCQQVAENPSRYTKTGADEALKLKLEWVELQAAVNPDLKKQQETEARLVSLKKRMAESLAGIL